MLSSRQAVILNSLVQEYINLAQPVGSQMLEKKHKFGLCPATIRNEMQQLTEAGFLYQPHTSAGRVPTDKGYRFFVDSLFEEGLENLSEDFNVDWQKEIRDSLKLSRDVTKFLAAQSSNLALGYLSQEKILWKEGWREIFQEPEFAQANFTSQFIQLLDDFEKNIENLFSDLPQEVQVYIGKENPFSKTREFSIIVAKCHFPRKQEGVLTILGPKRMAYDKNINLIDSITKLLETY